MPRCSIIIPVYNQASVTRQCLEALRARPPEGVDCEIIVVDDASTDLTPELLAGYGDEIRVVTHATNAGFATACNDGAAVASGEYFVFLNNDTIPLPGWLEALARYAEEHPRAAVVGSKLLYPDNTVQHAGAVICQDGYGRHIYAGFPAEHPAVNRSRRFQIVTGACMLVRRDPFAEAGGFDTAYRNAYEDHDLCLRLGERGYEVHVCHTSVLYHLTMVSRAGRTADFEASTRLFRERWAGRVEPDDFRYYIEDGLLRVEYWESYPIEVSLSPLLAIVEEHGRAREADRLLSLRARQVFDLLMRNTQLDLRLREAELAAGSGRGRGESLGEGVGAERLDCIQQLTMQLDGLRAEVETLQAQLGAANALAEESRTTIEGHERTLAEVRALAEERLQRIERLQDQLAALEAQPASSAPPSSVEAVVVDPVAMLSRLEARLSQLDAAYQEAKANAEEAIAGRLAEAEAAIAARLAEAERKHEQAEATAAARLQVIEEQERALEAYRYWDWRARWRRFRSPKLGVLYQYAPRPIEIPARYWEAQPPLSPPLISIVTTSFNQGGFIERTIKSVLDQRYPKLEYIIQDADSTDETGEILKRHRDSLAHVESRRDNGLAHGLNLGFQHASGEILAYLNSDDLLLPGALHSIARFFEEHPEVDVVYGHRVVIDEYDAEVGRWVLPPHDDDVLSWADFVPQETMFWRRRIWERAGGAIDESFRFAVDWDLLLRFREAGARVVRLPRFLGAFRVHPHQKTSAELGELGQREMARLRERCHGRPVTEEEVATAVRWYLRRHVACHKLYRLGLLRY